MKNRMKVLCKIQNTPVASVADIIEFEKRFNLNLPYDFKWFLLTQNPWQVAEKNYSKIACIHCFYPISNKIEANLIVGYESLVHFLGMSYLPFAYDSGGWQFVVCVEEGEHYGKVYFCRMNEYLENALTLLADSFTDFVNGLKGNDEC